MAKEKQEQADLIGLGDKLSSEHLNTGKSKTRNKILLVLAVLVLGAILYFTVFASNSGPQYEFSKVARKDLKESVEVTGNVEAGATLALTFREAGQIDKINYAVGDKVKTGDVIASLKNRDEDLQLQRAKATLAGSQANLNQKVAGSTSQDVKIGQAGVDRANAAADKVSIDYQNAQQEIDLIKKKNFEQEKKAQLLVADAKSKYDYAVKNQGNTGQTQEQAVETAKEDLEAQLYSTGSAIQQSLLDLKAIIVTSNGTSELGGDINRFDPYKLNDALNIYNEVQLEFDPMYLQIKSATNYTPDQLKAFAVKEQSEVTKLLNAQKMVADGLSTLSSSVSLPAEKINQLKSGILADNATISASLSGLNLKYQAILNAELGVNTSTDTQLSAVSSAKSFYDQTVQDMEQLKIDHEVDLNSRQANIKSLQAQYAVAKADVESAEASLDQTKAGPRAVDLAFLRADVAANQIAVSIAQEALEKTLLRAPMDGQLSRKNIDVGEDVISSNSAAAASGEGVFEMISNDKFKINAEIAEVDIGKIHLGDKAEITLDAVGDKTTFDGTIAQIDPVQTVIQDVVFYKAEVIIESTDARIKPGMTANIEIVLNKADKSLTVPDKAVQTDGDRKYVRILNGEKIKEIDVITGIRDLQGNVEIKSGLTEGQDIILRTLNARS